MLRLGKCVVLLSAVDRLCVLVEDSTFAIEKLSSFLIAALDSDISLNFIQMQ